MTPVELKMNWGFNSALFLKHYLALCNGLSRQILSRKKKFTSHIRCSKTETNQTKKEKMANQVQNQTVSKSTSWAVSVFHLLIVLEFFYMASPFAVYFYSVYGPGLNFVNSSPALAWLSSMFLPHIVVDTSSSILNQHNIVGSILFFGGFIAFCIGAGQVYYYKFAKKGPVLGGIYNFIRHPQYTSLAIGGLGLLLLWPRYIVLLSFVAMLFAYFFLAKIEERECEEKFGEAYLAYQDKTNMFFPFRIPLVNRLPSLPNSRLKKIPMIIALYLITSLVTVGLANGLKVWSINSLYAHYTKEAIYLSIVKLEKSSIKRMVKIALANPNIQARTEIEGIGSGTRFINYVLPANMDVSEIPMNPVRGARGEHFLPAAYKGSIYRIVFTEAKLRNRGETKAEEILLNTLKTEPVIEVLIDLSLGKIVDIKNPTATRNYEGIPVPIF